MDHNDIYFRGMEHYALHNYGADGKSEDLWWRKEPILKYSVYLKFPKTLTEVSTTDYNDSTSNWNKRPDIPDLYIDELGLFLYPSERELPIVDAACCIWKPGEASVAGLDFEDGCLIRDRSCPGWHEPNPPYVIYTAQKAWQQRSYVYNWYAYPYVALEGAVVAAMYYPKFSYPHAIDTQPMDMWQSKGKSYTDPVTKRTLYWQVPWDSNWDAPYGPWDQGYGMNLKRAGAKHSASADDNTPYVYDNVPVTVGVRGFKRFDHVKDIRAYINADTGVTT